MREFFIAAILSAVGYLSFFFYRKGKQSEQNKQNKQVLDNVKNSKKRIEDRASDVISDVRKRMRDFIRK